MVNVITKFQQGLIFVVSCMTVKNANIKPPRKCPAVHYATCHSSQSIIVHITDATTKESN